jgi:DNA polymerase-3 subunit epsilon
MPPNSRDLLVTGAVAIGPTAVQLKRPLAVLDVEATGVDVSLDRVVEIAVVRVSPDGRRAVFHRRVNPGLPIPAPATAVHGIRDEDVIACPTFAAIAGDLLGVLAGADLAGFGIARFDIPLLAAEFARAGSTFPLAGRAVVDALAIYHRHEGGTWPPRSGYFSAATTVPPTRPWPTPRPPSPCWMPR